MTPPIVRVGWQTDQSANSKDLSFALNPEHYKPNPRLGAFNGASNLLQGTSTSVDVKVPIFPSSTGYTARATGTPALSTAVGYTDFDPAYTPQSFKYQYWAVKFSPYIETSFVMTNQIFIDQLL